MLSLRVLSLHLKSKGQINGGRPLQWTLNENLVPGSVQLPGPASAVTVLAKSTPVTRHSTRHSSCRGPPWRPSSSPLKVVPHRVSSGSLPPPQWVEPSDGTAHVAAALGLPWLIPVSHTVSEFFSSLHFTWYPAGWQRWRRQRLRRCRWSRLPRPIQRPSTSRARELPVSVRFAQSPGLSAVQICRGLGGGVGLQLSIQDQGSYGATGLPVPLWVESATWLTTCTTSRRVCACLCLCVLGGPRTSEPGWQAVSLQGQTVVLQAPDVPSEALGDRPPRLWQLAGLHSSLAAVQGPDLRAWHGRRPS